MINSSSAEFHSLSNLLKACSGFFSTVGSAILLHMALEAFLIIFLLLLFWIIYRMRKFPLAKGLRRLAPLSVPLFFVHRPLLRLANMVIRHFPRPKGEEGSFESSDGTRIGYTLYRGEGSGRQPCLVYFHGGGFFFEASSYLYRKCKSYAREAGCTVLVIRYRTSDRWPWPKCMEDAISALRYVCSNADSLNVDSTRLAVGGDSAGGFLAASTALWAADNGIPLVAQLLVYPVLDNRMNTLSMKRFRSAPVWNARLSRRMWKILLDGSGDFISPLDSRLPQDLAPAYIEVAEYDCLRDEALVYATVIGDSGIPVTVSDMPSTCHGYDALSKAPVVSAAQQKRVDALKKAFSVQMPN